MSESHAHLLALIHRWLASSRAPAPAPSLAWRQTYGPDEVGAAFIENYGWTELFGARGRERAKTAGGLVLLGPNTSYPAHRHEAEEIYLPLSGAAHWRQGDALWRERPPGTLIHHCSEEIHAMRTGKEPLLALYLWRSEQLPQNARLVRHDDEVRPDAARSDEA